MKKGAPHPDSKQPVHKVQHSDTYKVSQYYGSEKNECYIILLLIQVATRHLYHKDHVLIVVKSSNDIKNKYHPSLAFYCLHSVLVIGRAKRDPPLII